MVNIPLTKMTFHLDNGMGEQLSGTGLSATYNFIEKNILIWPNILNLYTITYSLKVFFIRKRN